MRTLYFYNLKNPIKHSFSNHGYPKYKNKIVLLIPFATK